MVELIPKAKRPKAVYPVADIFFKASVAFVAFSILVYAGIFLLVERQKDTLKSAQDRASQLFGASEREILNEVTLLNKEISQAKVLTKELVKSSDVMSLVEGLVHSDVQLTSMTFDAKTRNANLSLRAKDIRVFWEQMRIFRAAPEIADVDVRRFSLGKSGEALFDVVVSFNFTPNFFVWDQNSL